MLSSMSSVCIQHDNLHIKLRQSFAFCAIFSIIVFVVESLLSQDLRVASSAAKTLIVGICLQVIIFGVSSKFTSIIAGILTGFGVIALASLGFLSQAFVYFGWIGLGIGVYCFRNICFVRISDLKGPVVSAFSCYSLCWFCETYTSFNILARVSRGHIHQDTLFHASIAGMIKSFGVASTGLSGLVPIKYHVFSHVLVAGLSNLTGVPVLEIYGISALQVFVPICLALAGAYGISLCRQSIGLHASTIAFTFLLCVIPIWGNQWAIWLTWIGSESNLVALCLLYAVLSDLTSLAERSPNASIVSSITAFTITVLATLSKGPIGIAIWTTYVLMVPNLKSRSSLITCLCSTIGLVSALSMVAGDSGMTVKPLSFFIDWVRGGSYTANLVSGQNVSPFLICKSAVIFFMGFLAHFCIPVVALVIYSGVKFPIWNSFIAKLIVATIVLGAIPVLTVYVGGGSQGYFSSIPMFVALPLISTWLVTSAKDRKYMLCIVCVAFVVLLVSVYKHRQELRATFVTKRERAVANPLLERLVRIRNTPNLGSQRIDSVPDIGNNPIGRCTARPFVYPAMSERAWYGLIENNGPCEYVDYGYRDYKRIIDTLR